MLLLGIDLGTSAAKVSVIDAQTQQLLASATWPETEVSIESPQPGWAEQSPDLWWENVKGAILKCHTKGSYNPKEIAAIGIAYQMHGLVLTNAANNSIRNSIIWCDSRAVETGEKAFHDLGADYCLQHLLNSPGNFTASKLAWVKQHEPFVYNKVHQFMLPGDFISLKMTGVATTTVSALSEGIFWDFRDKKVSTKLMEYYQLNNSMIPGIQPVFSEHGFLMKDVAEFLMLREGIPVSYKAGDQPNNALALNVLEPGEVAATAGTSGVIYAVTDGLDYDPQSRVNSFAHVNHSTELNRIGVLLCINGAGIFNKWVRQLAGQSVSYEMLNQMASTVPQGSDGLLALPFGNGAERMLNNQLPGAQFINLDLNKHSLPHIARAIQESVAFAFRYGLDIMRENGMDINLVRAGRANLFLSDIFAGSFSSITNLAVEFYEGDGSFGAAIGAGVGAGIYQSAAEAGNLRKPLHTVEAAPSVILEERYNDWKSVLKKQFT
ncbi:MAG: FGGY family carbohydrate kinase [Chitinophagaceae bacterium]|nr:FGGY family carbohydrate kinase [Chitinophagaceae bacterium]